jgi:hypothetical protein
MTDARDDRILELCHRVEALEAARTTASRRPGRTLAQWGARLARACVGLLVVSVGWVMAQTPPPGTAQPAGPESAVIRKGPDGITRVTGPLQVVDPSGKVILSVAGTENSAAATSISLSGGGGEIVTFSSKGAPSTVTRSEPAGQGIFIAYDASGKQRATVLGNSGGFMTMNEAGKQVAVIGSSNGKGVIGIYSDRSERLAVLSEAAAGGGELTIFDKSHTKTALVGADAAGGVLQLHGAGKTALTVELGANDGGGGVLELMDRSGRRAAMLTGSDSLGTGELVIEKDGRPAATLSVNNVGAGDLVLSNPSGGPGLTANGTLEDAPGRGAGIRIFNSDGDQVLGLGTRDDGSGTVNVQEKGKVLVALQRGDTGKGGQLSVRNADGAVAVEASGSVEGGGIIVFNKSADPVATMEVSPENKGSITIFETDHAVVELTADKNSAGTLLLKDRGGNTAVDASADDGGAVLISNAAGDLVAAVQSTSAGKGAFTVLEKGVTAAELTATASGTGYMYVADAEGSITLDVDGAAGEVTALQKDQVVATFGSNEGRGRIAAYGKSGVVAELAETSAGAAQVSVRNSQKSAVAGLATTAGGAGVVIVANGGGATLAHMGATADGRGEIKVLDAGGAVVVAMAKAPDSNGGAIDVYNGNIAVAHIRSGGAGGGYIQLTDGGGQPAVEAGVSPAGVGVVRAGPNYKCGSNYMGLKIPDCIVGVP